MHSQYTTKNFRLKHYYSSFNKKSWNPGRFASLNWRLIETFVVKQQTKIYYLSKFNLKKKMRRVQKNLLNTFATKLLAVRQVCVENNKKRDEWEHDQNIKEYYSLAKSLTLDGRAQPVRRVYIPKEGKKEMRPLGIPSFKDRALQALVRFVIEPEWEAIFERGSYGFRSGRGCADAIKHLEWSLQKPKYVLDADIRKCFDMINHEALLQKLGYKGALRTQIKAWLEAGYLEGKVFKKTESGTPQGGVISPLLANIALHGLESDLKKKVATLKLWRKDGTPMNDFEKKNSLDVIRYADDFVILHSKKSVIEACKEEVQKWLRPIGLELNQEKTRVCHTLLPCEKQKPGFCFLGFKLKYIREKKKLLLWIAPTDKALNKHLKELQQMINAFIEQINNLLSAPQSGQGEKKTAGDSKPILPSLNVPATEALFFNLLMNLNRKIIGWIHYFDNSYAKKKGFFARLDFILANELKRAFIIYWEKLKKIAYIPFAIELFKTCINDWDQEFFKQIKRLNKINKFTLKDLFNQPRLVLTYRDKATEPKDKVIDGKFIIEKRKRYPKSYAFPGIVSHHQLAKKFSTFQKVVGTKSPFDGDMFYWSSRVTFYGKKSFVRRGFKLYIHPLFFQILDLQHKRCAICNCFLKQKTNVQLIKEKNLLKLVHSECMPKQNKSSQKRAMQQYLYSDPFA